MRRRLVAGRRDEVFLGNLCALFNAGSLGALTDGQLLERFCTGPEAEAELAFTALDRPAWPGRATDLPWHAPQRT